MIKHLHLDRNGFRRFPDTAQSAAERCNRQEVTADWYLDNMCDAPLWRWVDNQIELGLDPWRLCDEVPGDKCRLFVQRRDFAEYGINEGKHDGKYL